MVFEPSHAVRIRSTVRCPSEILLRAIRLCLQMSWMHTLAYCHHFNTRVRMKVFYFHYVFFVFVYQKSSEAIHAAGRVASLWLKLGTTRRLHIAAGGCWSEVLVEILMVSLLWSCPTTAISFLNIGLCCWNVPWGEINWENLNGRFLIKHKSS